jgi:hypothetical protein
MQLDTTRGKYKDFFLTPQKSVCQLLLSLPLQAVTHLGFLLVELEGGEVRGAIIPPRALVVEGHTTATLAHPPRGCRARSPRHLHRFILSFICFTRTACRDLLPTCFHVFPVRRFGDFAGLRRRREVSREGDCRCPGMRELTQRFPHASPSTSSRSKIRILRLLKISALPFFRYQSSASPCPALLDNCSCSQMRLAFLVSCPLPPALQRSTPSSCGGGEGGIASC